MWRAIKERIVFWWKSCGVLWRVLVVIYTIFGALTLYRDNFMSADDQKQYATMNLLPKLSWKYWVVAFVVIFVGAVLEGAFRAHKGDAFTAAPSSTTLSDEEIAERKRRFQIGYVSVLGRMFGLLPMGRTVAEPAKIEINPHELRRLDRSSGHRDIFLRGTITLVKPVEIKIDSYSMELSRSGIKEHPDLVDDVDKWRLMERDSNPPQSYPLCPLPTLLRSGHPMEGWIHFVSKRNQYELESGKMLFCAHTQSGDGAVFVPCDNQYWNAVRHNFLFYSGED